MHGCYFNREEIPCGMPIADKGLIFEKSGRFNKLFALLDPKNTNSPNHDICHFHASEESDVNPES